MATVDIDRETWIILAERSAAIRRLREERVDGEVELVFDIYDQASVVSRESSTVSTVSTGA